MSTTTKAAIVAAIVVAIGVGVWLLSDERLKRDIRLVRRRPDGIGLYRYRYVGSEAVHVGVLAQEVAGIVPDAVSIDEDGWYRVDYARLGLRPPADLPETIAA